MDNNLWTSKIGTVDYYLQPEEVLEVYAHVYNMEAICHTSTRAGQFNIPSEIQTSESRMKHTKIRTPSIKKHYKANAQVQDYN